ncbi:hypothetical protein [Sphingomonas glacialis]|uniref:hypothetical protein n=1 Tax=Sphingomonas glacialis TaxID=658225 RepID=UPI001126946E|nr:hypothetical protein [Sphingomonas glacialis]
MPTEKRACRSRTFARVRRKEHVSLARYCNNHPDKLDACDQRDFGAVVSALGSNLMAGFAK